MPSRRQRRVSEQIHREISSLLMFEVRDPRLELLTITGVEVSPDLEIAHVYYSTLGDQEAAAGIKAGLEHAKGYLRTQLAARIRLRFAPNLFFHLDRSAEYGQHIDELLDGLARPVGAGLGPAPAEQLPDDVGAGSEPGDVGQSDDESGPA